MGCNTLFEPKRVLIPPTKTKPETVDIMDEVMVFRSDHTAAKTANIEWLHRFHR
jgi:hypothetical protein